MLESPQNSLDASPEMIGVESLVAKVLSYNPDADTGLIKKSFEFSSKAHEGQKRRSGQPYVIHPLEVASILADMKMDVASIVAAILHDTIEDTDITKAVIEENFGNEIAEIVDGVTKLSKLKFNTQEERQAENFRKMIIAMSKDIRVILIKLADRLNNLKTLQFMPEEKQMRISQETLDIYAPLANRMGIDWMKTQLEDLSLRFMKPDIFKTLEKKLSLLNKNSEQFISRVEDALRAHFGSTLSHVQIKGRIKHIYSIYKKMERQNVTFEQLNDLLAFRILTKNIEECYEVLGLIHSLWKPVPGRFKDYIAMPKANNYQSLHTTVVCVDGARVEFQIRTSDMHETAEKGIAAHWKYKSSGKIDMESEKTFQWLNQLMDWQKELKDSIEFLDTVKLDLFSSDIFVFTPRGEVKALPYGATPIDFAYSIHTDLGNRCSGSKVNGRMAPLSYKLQSGDEVEIITQQGKGPSKDWLKIVASSRAKAKIRQYVKQAQRDRSIELGKKLFHEECHKLSLNVEEVFKMPACIDYLKKKGIVGEANFYSMLAYGKLSLTAFFTHVVPEKNLASDTPEGVISKIFKKVGQKNRNTVLVEGIDDILVTFGKCCMPIKGDPIIGFVTRGRGVTIHRTDCYKVYTIDIARRVTATWNAAIDLTRTARLVVSCENKPGLLAGIAQKMSDKNINISKVLVHSTRDEKAIITMDVEVGHIAELQSVMKSIEGVSGVIHVERSKK